MEDVPLRRSARKVARIRCITDDDVEDHILPIYKTNGDTPNKKEMYDSFLSEPMNSDFDDPLKERKTPQVLHEDGDRVGVDIFSFKSNKSKGKLMEAVFKNLKLAESTPKGKQIATPSRKETLMGNKTPRQQRISTPTRKESVKGNKTPRAQRILTPACKDSVKGNKTPREQRISASVRKESVKANKTPKGRQISTTEHQTPYNLRRKIKQRLARLGNEEENLSDSNSSDTDGSDSDDCTDTPAISDEINFEHLRLDVDAKPMAENYFRAHLKKSVTSNNTLKGLDTPCLDYESLQKALKAVAPTHVTYVETLCVQHTHYFEKWMFQLSEGFNLLFYGLGSKRRLLLDFREKMLAEDNCLVINGFFSNVSLKTILSSLIEEIYDAHSSNNPQEMLNTIKTLVSKNQGNLYIIIHNIDGTMLRSEKLQNAICKLAEIDKISILASIDHINAPLIWDQNKLSQLNWIWHDVTTFIPYTDETTFEHNILVQPSDNIVLSSLVFVFRSLNPKAKKIFLMLANYQLDHKDNKSYIGMSYQDCYRKCRENFLVNSDLTLKTQLTEFKDHKIIKFKKGPDSIEYLLIPLEANVLSDFVEQHKL